MRSIFINTTHRCNLNCSYCYEKDLDLATQPIVNIKHVKKLIRLVAAKQKQVSVLFHGGEPLTLPVGFYEEIKEYGRSFSDVQFRYSMQSNGTLLNEENIKLFATQNDPIHIGLSYDGLSNYKHRCPNQMVLDKMHFLYEHNVPFGIITVANTDYLENIREEYAHLKELTDKYQSMGFSLNWVFGDSANEEYTQLYIKSMGELFDVWLLDPQAPQIELFMELLGMYYNKSNLIRGACLNCHQHWVGMDVDGLLGMCDFGVYPRSISLGHIDEVDDLYDIQFNPKRLELIKQVSQRQQLCYKQQCPLLGKCTGGCNGRIYRINNSLSGLDEQHCTIMRELYQHASDKLAATRIEDMNPHIKRKVFGTCQVS